MARQGSYEMELKRAKKIANYVVPRLLAELSDEVKLQLIKPGENEEALLFRLTEKAASDIQWKATLEENNEQEKHM